MYGVCDILNAGQGSYILSTVRDGRRTDETSGFGSRQPAASMRDGNIHCVYTYTLWMAYAYTVNPRATNLTKHPRDSRSDNSTKCL